MFNRPEPEQIDRMIGKLMNLAEGQAEIAARLARMETRLFRLARAMGHEDAMHKETDERH